MTHAFNFCPHCATPLQLITQAEDGGDKERDAVRSGRKTLMEMVPADGFDRTEDNHMKCYPGMRLEPKRYFAVKNPAFKPVAETL